MGSSRLGSLLVKEGHLSDSDRRMINRTSGNRGAAFAKTIVALGIMDEAKLAHFLVSNSKFQRVNQRISGSIPTDVIGAIDHPLLERLEVVPLKLEGKTLTVAMADPLDTDTIHQLKFFTGYEIRPIVATFSEIYDGLTELLHGFKPSVSKLQEFLSHHISATTGQGLKIKGATKDDLSIQTVESVNDDDDLSLDLSMEDDDLSLDLELEDHEITSSDDEEEIEELEDLGEIGDLENVEDTSEELDDSESLEIESLESDDLDAEDLDTENLESEDLDAGNLGSDEDIFAAAGLDDSGGSEDAGLEKAGDESSIDALAEMVASDGEDQIDEVVTNSSEDSESLDGLDDINFDEDDDGIEAAMAGLENIEVGGDLGTEIDDDLSADIDSDLGNMSMESDGGNAEEMDQLMAGIEDAAVDDSKDSEVTDQEDIDAMFDEGGDGPDVIEEEGGGDADQSEIDAMFAGETGSSEAIEEQASESVEQDDIDTMFSGESEKTQTIEEEDSGNVDQSDIDSMFAGEPEVSDPEEVKSSESVEQDDIDSMFAGDSSNSEPIETEESECVDQGDLDAMFDDGADEAEVSEPKESEAATDELEALNSAEDVKPEDAEESAAVSNDDLESMFGSENENQEILEEQGGDSSDDLTDSPESGSDSGESIEELSSEDPAIEDDESQEPALDASEDGGLSGGEEEAVDPSKELEEAEPEQRLTVEDRTKAVSALNRTIVSLTMAPNIDKILEKIAMSAQSIRAYRGVFMVYEDGQVEIKGGWTQDGEKVRQVSGEEASNWVSNQLLAAVADVQNFQGTVDAENEWSTHGDPEVYKFEFKSKTACMLVSMPRFYIGDDAISASIIEMLKAASRKI